MGKWICALCLTVILGGTCAAETILFEFQDSEGRREWGQTPTPLGDVDGDGFDDIALHLGDQVLVFFGGPQADAIADWTVPCPGSPAAGYPVRGPFDVDGDGRADLVVTCPEATVREMEHAGAVYFFWGGGAVGSTPDAVLEGPWSDYHFGTGACRAGRFLDAGPGDDVAVTVGRHVGWGPAPTVEVHAAGDPPDPEAGWGRSELLYDDGWEGRFRYAGDMDGDGYGDIATAAPEADSYDIFGPVARAGRLFLYRGGPDRLDGGTVVEGPSEGATLGEVLATDLDLNGDGFSDALATLPKEGRTWAIWGHPSMGGSVFYPDLELPGGLAVGALGDVDGDGADDCATLSLEGLLRIFRGGQDVDATAEATLALPAGDDRRMVRVAGVGDFDGDGRADIGVGLRESAGFLLWKETYRIYSGAALFPVPSQETSVGRFKAPYRGGGERR